MKNVKKLSLLISLFAIAMPLVGCNHDGGSSNKVDKLKPVKVFDWYHDGTVPTSSYSFEMEELENPKFTFYANNIKQANTSFAINNVNALYLFDANNDGYRDICVSGSTKTKKPLDYSAIYDVKNNKRIFYIVDTVAGLYNDYHFSLNLNSLVLTKDKCDNSAVINKTYSSGVMKYSEEKGVYVGWRNDQMFDRCSFSLKAANTQSSDVEIKNENDVITATLNTHTLYSLTVDYYSSANNIKDLRPYIFSLANHNPNDDNLVLYDEEDLAGTHTMYFYFLDKGTANYEIQASGYSQFYNFNIKNESGHTISDFTDIDVLRANNITQEENDLKGTYDYLCRVTDVTRSNDIKELFSMPLFEISDDMVKVETELEHRFTFTFSGGEKKVVDILSDRLLKYNSKYYVVLGYFRFEDIAHEDYVGTFNFSLKEANAEAENLNSGEKIVVNNINTFMARRAYENREFTPSYKIRIGKELFYIADATTFSTSNSGGYNIYYNIISENNFSSLFQK